MKKNRNKKVKDLPNSSGMTNFSTELAFLERLAFLNPPLKVEWKLIKSSKQKF